MNLFDAIFILYLHTILQSPVSNSGYRHSTLQRFYHVPYPDLG